MKLNETIGNATEEAVEIAKYHGVNLSVKRLQPIVLGQLMDRLDDIPDLQSLEEAKPLIRFEIRRQM